MLALPFGTDEPDTPPPAPPRPEPKAPPELFDPEFFPTPRKIIDVMLNRINREARYFLEPSAGRGDIARAILCTVERERLRSIVAECGDVEELGLCFRDAERRTDVDVVLVYLKKLAQDDRVELWETGTPEQELGDLLEDANLPAVRDRLGNMQRFYDEANRHMLLAFEHARKAQTFMEANKISDYSRDRESDYKTILGQALNSTIGHSRAEFLRKHRRDAWLAVFSLMEFHKWLDKKQTDELIRDVSTSAHFPFTAENIKGTLENVLLQRRKLFEQSAWNVFEALTKFFDGNTNHTEGWKSNDGFKVNPKLVFPWGVRYEKDWGFSGLWYNRSAVDIYNDLDRVLAVLDGKTLDTVQTIGTTLQREIDRDRHEPHPCESDYFEIRYFKKGTVHLKWKRYDLLEKFNVTAANGRKWIGDTR